MPRSKQSQAVFELLENRVKRYEQANFIPDDPICIPRSMERKEDAEIAGFLAATIAWGNRKSILNNCYSLLERMDQSPHEFVLKAGPTDLRRLEGFVHRTFNDTDLLYFMSALRMIYRDRGGLESVFASAFRQDAGTAQAIHSFREVFFSLEHPERTRKHVADPLRGSTAKRLNMFLRWMVRSSEAGVDLGLWTSISPSQLYLPLDVHTGKVARRLGLLKRKQNDWKAVEEVTANLRTFDPLDPVRYDFALFGIGVYEGGA